jgi:hypothetical protein
MMKSLPESFEMPLLASNMTPLIRQEISQPPNQNKEFNKVTSNRNVYEVIRSVDRPQQEGEQPIILPGGEDLKKQNTMISDSIEQKSISPTYSTEASGHRSNTAGLTPQASTYKNKILASYRAEILRLAQRRDILRLRKTVTMLVQEEKLSVDELNKCLILHHSKYCVTRKF